MHRPLISERAVLTIAIIALVCSVSALALQGVYVFDQPVEITATGADALDVAGGIESGGTDLTNANGVLQVPTNALLQVHHADNSVGQAEHRDNSVGANELRTATFNQSGSGKFAVPGDGLSFFPDLTSGGGYLLSDSSADMWTWNDYDANVGGESVWYYMTDSDEPSVWVILDATGVVVDIWEAEDPISEGDTVAPLAIPDEEDGTVVKTGVPTLPIIQALYARLTSDQQAGALARTRDYVVGRGWVTYLPTLDGLSSIEARYAPSGRQWAMRCAANAVADLPGCLRGPVTTFYQDYLVVTNGAWSLAP